MDLFLNEELAIGYTSMSQKARVMTEGWVVENLYCPVCGNAHINHFPNNRAVADFYCPSCDEQYELKSKKGELKGKVVDGAYNTFIERIESNNGPDFLFMSYDVAQLKVYQLSFVPKFFFVPDIAERRNPLSSKAKRAGWIGCNIMYDRIPMQGRIAIIKDQKTVEREIVQNQVSRAFELKVENIESRGWMFDVLHCVNGIMSDEFTLNQIYQFEDILAVKYPQNRNIRAKIRQQMQVLRDRGIIEFLGQGRYRKIKLERGSK